MRRDGSTVLFAAALLCAVAAAQEAAAQEAAARVDVSGPRGPVTDLVLLEDGARLEVHARGADRVDAKSARSVFARRPDRTIAAARVGPRIVLAGGEASKKGIVTLHRASGEQLARVLVTKDSVHRVAAAPDARRVAIADADGRVVLIRVLREEPYLRVERELCRHAGGAHALAFSPDGSMLASGGQDGLVLLSSVDAAGEAKPRPRVFDDHRAPVLALAFSPRGDELASTSSDGALRIHATKGRLLRSWLDLGRGLRALSWMDGGEAVLLACGDGRLRLCDRRGERVRTIGKEGRALFSLVVRRRRAIAGTWDGIRVFNVPARP